RVVGRHADLTELGGDAPVTDLEAVVRRQRAGVAAVRQDLQGGGAGGRRRGRAALALAGAGRRLVGRAAGLARVGARVVGLGARGGSTRARLGRSAAGVLQDPFSAAA